MMDSREGSRELVKLDTDGLEVLLRLLCLFWRRGVALVAAWVALHRLMGGGKAGGGQTPRWHRGTFASTPCPFFSCRRHMVLGAA